MPKEKRNFVTISGVNHKKAVMEVAENKIKGKEDTIGQLVDRALEAYFTKK